MNKGGVLLVKNQGQQTANEAKEYATMNRSTTDLPALPVRSSQDLLTDVLRQGAQQLLTQAIEAEVTDWTERHEACRNAGGQRQVATATCPREPSSRASAPSR